MTYSWRRVGLVLLGLIMVCTPAYAQEVDCGDQQTARQTANRDTVGIISGSVRGTYSRFAQDMADKLDQDCILRVVPVLGRGSVQNVADLLWLKGIDIAVVQSDVFEAFLNRKLPGTRDIREKIQYIMKLYNEEVHILAKRDIINVRDLNGRRVSIGGKGSGTTDTSKIIFDALEIPVETVQMPNSVAIDAVKKGEIAAAVFVAGKPAGAFADIREDDGLHFLRVEIDRILEDKGYISSEFSHDDYPQLVSAGRATETIAVGAVMAVYRWKKTSSRYRRTALFAKRLLEELPELQKSTAFHPKWKQVDPRAVVPGWERFEPVSRLLN